MSGPAFFSEKFITLDAHERAGHALELVESLRPEYLVISNAPLANGRYYVVDRQTFLDQAGMRLHDLGSDLSAFLRLDEADPVPTVVVAGDVTRDPLLAQEVRRRFAGHPGGFFFGLVLSGDTPRAVFDPQRGLARAAPYAPEPPVLAPPQPPVLDEFSGGGEAAEAGAGEEAGLEPVQAEEAPRPVPRRRGGGREEEAAAPEPVREIVRYPEATFPQQAAVGKLCPLRIVITPRVVAGVAGLALQVDADRPSQDAVEVLVFLEAPGFEVLGDPFGTLSVPLAATDSDPLFFSLRARPDGVGPQTIKLQFSQVGGRYLGQVSLATQVVPADQDGSGATATAQGDVELGTIQRRDPDLTLMVIEKDPTAREYQFVLTSPAEVLDLFFVEKGQFRFALDPDQQFRQFFEEIETPDTRLAPEEFAGLLAEKGRLLYQELFPDPLKELFWDARDRIRTIQIVSEEPWIPWEIVKPWRMNDQTGEVDEDEFLCERYVVARWLKGRNVKEKDRVARIRLVVPEDSGLISAYRERQWLEQFASERRLLTQPARTRPEVLKALAEGGFDLLHISCHGLFNPDASTKSTLYLQEKSPLTVESLSGLAAKFGFENPIVFLNACQTGRQGYSLTGIGSWARQFLAVRCAAFIGSLWSVNDDLAFTFAQAFYTRLSAGAPLGEAVRDARLAVKAADPNDPTYLAYTLYADPGLSVEFGPSPE